MKQLSGQYPTQELVEPELDKIQMTVVVNIQQSNLNLQITIPQDIPFNVFIDGIKLQIFAQRIQDQYDDKIEYQLQNGLKLQENDSRSLKELGFTNQCTLYVRLSLRKICRHCQQKGQTIKVQVEYEIPYNPNISMAEQTNKIKNAIHFNEGEISNVSISSIKIDPQQY